MFKLPSIFSLVKFTRAIAALRVIKTQFFPVELLRPVIDLDQNPLVNKRTLL